MAGAAPSPDRLYFVGIGGAGMAPLALLAQSQGYIVSGSDREANSKTAELLRHGIQVTIGHAAENLPPSTGMLV